MKGASRRSPGDGSTDRLEPLSDADLRRCLEAALPDLPVLEVSSRASFKDRSDWRGRRLFERIAVSGIGEVCLKYFAPAARDRLDGHGPECERRAYRFLDGLGAAGVPRYYGGFRLAAGSRSVLVMEYVRGRRLKKIRRHDTWMSAAETLGRLHGRVSREGVREIEPGLPRRDPNFYRRWAEHAVGCAVDRSPEMRGRLEAVVAACDPVAETLGEAIPTLVHGELYCTNVMIRDGGAADPFCFFDWETASIGCGTLDIAYLGRQEMGVEREALLRAYASGWARAGGPPVDERALWAQHEAARVHERIYLLWSACVHREASADKIRKYADRLDTLLANFRNATRGLGVGT